MNMLQTEVYDSIKNAGCLDFIYERSECALSELQKKCPAVWEMLSEEAKECLRINFADRFELIYLQALMQEIKPYIERHDPVGIMLGRIKNESVTAGAKDFYKEVTTESKTLCRETTGASGSKEGNVPGVETYLHDKYPLLKEYSENIYKNFTDSFALFFDSFYEKKQDIEEVLLGGRYIGKIIHLSTGGADVHRHGRCVTGVKTDVGTVYYKPHDCGLDMLYHEIVERFFSENTMAAGVVAGEGFAFVSCLEKKEAETTEQVHRYFYNFGVLSALFHGLGSTDMHFENIMACGMKPSAIDIETLLGVTEDSDDNSGINLFQSQTDLRLSLIRTLILPTKMYKGPNVSPLYYNGEDRMSLPEIGGKAFTVEGYEEDFLKGFSEGYDRMLTNREEIKKIISAHGNATLRCLLNNTDFYAHIRNLLFAPVYLSDIEKRKKIYDKLCIPYRKFGHETDSEVVDYEWKCLMQGDIPYFCTTVNGCDLCGEDTDELVKTGFYKKSVQESACVFLDRLSPNEKKFELDLIKMFFRNAPTDVPEEEEQEPVSGDAADKGDIYREIKGIFDELQENSVRCRDGKLLWFSTAASLKGITGCGDISLLGDTGAFCVAVNSINIESGLSHEAERLAALICEQSKRELDMWESLKGEEGDRMWKVMPTGQYMGLGGVLKNFSIMEKAGIASAGDIIDKIIYIIADKKIYDCEKVSLAEGKAGLLVGMEAAGRTGNNVIAAVRACADDLLNKELPKRADLLYGSSGMGAALAAAFMITGDEKYFEGVLKAFKKVKETYNPKLSGWPDGEAKISFLADRGPYAAGIYLAAEYAKDMFANSSSETDRSSCMTQRIPKGETHKDSAKGKKGFTDLIEDVQALALDTLLKEVNILHNDSIDQGNALTVLAYLKAGKTEEAGKMIDSMIKRKKRTGSYFVTPPGIRSAFDPSLYMGTAGVGLSFCYYCLA